MVMRESLQRLAGPASIGLIVTGIWGLVGWQWALIALGIPPAAFYLYGEMRAVRAGSPESAE